MMRIDRELASYLKSNYSVFPKDQLERTIESMLSLITHCQDQRKSLKFILDQAVRTIFRLFEFKEVTIGLKSEEDGLFRYVSFLGFRDKVEKEFKKLAYTYQDMVDDEIYPNIKIGMISEYNVEEGTPESEASLMMYNRPFKIKRTRELPDQFLEGDYIDIFIHGRKGELIGFFEVSNTKDGKHPSRKSIRWMELIAQILGLAIQSRIYQKEINRLRRAD